MRRATSAVVPIDSPIFSVHGFSCVRVPPGFVGSVPTCYCLPVYHLACMPYRPQKLKKPEPKPGELKEHQFRADQHSDLRRREMTTRSTLSRLRNRKSDLK
jgi:hypothetical protein